MDVDGVGDSDMRNEESRGLGGDRRKRSHSQPRILVSNYKIGIIVWDYSTDSSTNVPRSSSGSSTKSSSSDVSLLHASSVGSIGISFTVVPE